MHSMFCLYADMGALLYITGSTGSTGTHGHTGHLYYQLENMHSMTEESTD